MNYIFIIIIDVILLVLLAIIFNLNPKKSKKIAENKKLNMLAEKYPSNIEICKDILSKLNNETVKIEEDNDAKDCLYMVAFNKIIIAGTQNNFTRIQTIAHECIHSIQDKKIQMFNFVLSNICILYFIVALVLGVLKVIPNNMLLLNIYIILSYVSFVVRAYLENDAMIKAKFLAREYMNEKKICSKEEIEKIVNGFDEINDMGIKGVNFGLMFGAFLKIIILSVIYAVL